MSPAKGHKDGEGPGASARRVEAERVGTVQTREEEAWEGSYPCVKIPNCRGEEDKARLSSMVFSDRTKGDGHKLKYKKFQR